MKDKYQDIVNSLPYAFAYHEIVKDDQGRAVDYIFLDVNTAFEGMTGLIGDNIIGRRVTEVIPGFLQSEFDWIGIYARVAETGESTTFKQLSEPLGRWYEITAFSDRKDFFCTIFKEVTEDVSEKFALRTIADLSELLLQGPGPGGMYEKIADAARKIAGAKYTGFNLFNPAGTAFTTVALAGVSGNLGKVIDVLGFNPVGKVWQYDPVREQQIVHSEITEFSSLHKLSGTVIAPKLVMSLEKVFNVGKTYVVKIITNNTMLGDFTIMMGQGAGLQNKAYLQVLASLIGQYIEFTRTQTLLRTKTEEMERFFAVSLDLLCIADTDGRLLLVNKAWTDILGYSQQELEKSKFLEFVHPDDLEPTLQAIANLKEQKPLLNFTNRYRSIDGSYKYIEWRSHPSGSLIYASGRDVTEKTEIAHELANSEQKFRRYTEKAPLSIFVTDLTGNFQLVNQAACRLTGFSEAELLRHSIIDIVTSEYRSEAVDFLENVVGRDFIEGDVRIKTKSDQKLWINLVAVSLNEKEIIGFAQDITEKKQIFEDLQISNARFDELARQSRTVTWSVDAGGKYTFISPLVLDVFGYTPDELVEQVHFYDLFMEEKREEIKQRFLTVFRKKEPFVSFINATRAKDGSEVIVSTNGLPILDEEGNLLGYNGSDTDITERVRLEDEKFFEQEKFKATLLSVGDGIIATDDEGRITVMNKVAEFLTGWTQEEAQGQTLPAVFRIIHEYTKETCEDPSRQVLLTGEVIELENHTALVARDGRVIPIEDSAAPIKNKNGAVIGVVIVFRDYTEKREKQKEVEYLSFHDHLTGLYNRRYLEDAINRLDTARNMPFSIIMADVNGLKLTNDAYGHHMGDKLLQTVARILSSACRSDDIIARTGGDEFTVLLPQTNSKQTEAIRRRIQGLIQETKLDSILVSLAIGHATKNDADQDIQGVMKQADNLMYKNKLKYGKLMRSQTIETVLRSISNKYDNEQIHTERVSTYCVAIARAMGFAENEIDEIKKMSVLHDIGKITVAPEILNKKEKLTVDEWSMIRQHAVTGYNILKSVEEYASLAEVVLHHHERWDGKGYPSGLKRKNIPLYSRIISVADAYEAMTAERPYQKLKSREEAIAELKAHAGTQFDPEIVSIFINRVLAG